jgi:hypothetical protein
MRDVPAGSSAHWEEVEEAWAELDARRTLDERHARLLDLWGEVVDTTRRIELARSVQAPSARYSRFEPAQAQRYSARSSLPDPEDRQLLLGSAAYVLEAAAASGG